MVLILIGYHLSYFKLGHFELCHESLKQELIEFFFQFGEMKCSVSHQFLLNLQEFPQYLFVLLSFKIMTNNNSLQFNPNIQSWLFSYCFLFFACSFDWVILAGARNCTAFDLFKSLQKKKLPYDCKDKDFMLRIFLNICFKY